MSVILYTMVLYVIKFVFIESRKHSDLIYYKFIINEYLA